MKIYVDGEEEMVKEGTTVADVVEASGHDYYTLIIEYNHEVLERETWPQVILQENDRLGLLLYFCPAFPIGKSNVCLE